MSGSQPRTLLGFNQVPKYPSPAVTTPARAATPLASSASRSSQETRHSESQPVTTDTSTQTQPQLSSASSNTFELLPPTAPAPELSSSIPANDTGNVATAAPQAQVPVLEPPKDTTQPQAEPTADTSQPQAEFTAIPSSPKLVDYSSRGKRKPPASLSAADEFASPDAPETSAPQTPVRRRSSVASASSRPQSDFIPDHVPAQLDHTDRPSSLRRVLGNSRDASSASLSSSPRASRRGYVDDNTDQGPNAPRDLLAEAAQYGHMRKGSSSSGGMSSGLPTSIAEQEDSEPPLPPGLALATDSPSIRSRRGVLLKSSNPALIGRRNRRRGSTSAGEGDAASFFSQDVSTHSSTPPQGQDNPQNPLEVTYDDDQASMFPEAFQDAATRAGGHDDEVESVVFHAGSALSHASDSSDDAGSGKAQGSQTKELHGVPDSINPTIDFGHTTDSNLSALDKSHDTSVGGDDDEDGDETSDGDEDDEEDDSPEVSHDSQPQSQRRGLSQTTLHAPLFAAAAAVGPTVRSPPGSLSPAPPPIPARRVRRSPSPTPIAPPQIASADDAQKARDEAERRRKRLELNRRLQADRAEWKKHILNADWEELEVARYLSQFGKHVHAVRGTQFLDAASFSQPAFPSRIEWTKYPDDGSPPRFNAFGYSVAWATAFLSYISPSRMPDLQQAHLADEEELEALNAYTQDEFRWGAVKASSERLYLSAMPLYEALGSRLRRTWRWESKLHSFAYMVTYIFLWWRGLLISSAIFGVIMLVLNLKTFPPKPDALREILARQKRREEEARRSRGDMQQDDAESMYRATQEPQGSQSQTTSDLPRSRYSLAVEATRKYGMQTSVVAGALADGHEKAKNFALWRSPRATWRLLFWLSLAFFVSLALKPVHLMRLPGAALGITFFIIGPIAEYKPQWLGVEWTNPLDWVFAGVPNDAQYSMEILRGRAAQGKPLLSDTALLMRPEVAMTMPVAASEVASPSSSVDWTRWADAVMKGKSLAITGSEILSGSRALNLPRLPVTEITASTSTSSALLTNITKGLNRGIKAIEDHRNKDSTSRDSSLARQRLGASSRDSAMTSSAEDATTADQDGTYWCVYDGVCGHLVVTPKSILFRSLFAKRPRGRRGQNVSLDSTMSGGSSQQSYGGGFSEDQALLDPATGQLTIPESSLADPATAPKIKILLEIPLNRIVGLKKVNATSSSSSAVKEASNWTSVGKKWNQLIQGEGGLQVLLERPKGRRGTSSSVASQDSASRDSAISGRSGQQEDVQTFVHMVKRDEAFNRLLALTPRQWTKVY